MARPRITIIGGGNMARALIDGCARSGVRTPKQWRVVEPDEQRRSSLERDGVECHEDVASLSAVIGEDEPLLLAVKPQMLREVARQLTAISDERMVITILAGVPSTRVREVMSGQVRVIRVMPNLPAQVGQGATAVSIGAGARAGDEELALELFRGIGPVVIQVEEELIDAFTAVAGSGPAYVFFLAEAMINAAMKVGFSGADADAIVRQTLRGASALLDSRREPPGNLRAAVTSQGGTTEAAMNVLEDGRMFEMIIRAIVAARDRGRELGATASVA